MINFHAPWQRLFQPPSNQRIRNPDNLELCFPASHPLTARQAWDALFAGVQGLDPQAILREAQALAEVAHDGTCGGWRFVFDAPNLRSMGACEWHSGVGTGVCLHRHELQAFPVVGSAEHQVLLSGMVPERWVDACWRSRMESTPALPRDFVDSPAALGFLAGRGISLEAAPLRLSLRCIEGEATWEVRLGEHRFCVPAIEELARAA